MLLALLMIAAFFDLETEKIPNWITFPGIILGLFLGTPSPAEKILGLLLFFFLGMFHLMQMGDLKLLMMIHTFLGFFPALFIAGIAALLLILYALIIKKIKGKELKDMLFSNVFQMLTLKKVIYTEQESYVFAPFLFLGTVIFLGIRRCLL